MIDLAQEQHIGSEINIVNNKIEHEEMNGNHQKYQSQKFDQIEEIIFGIDGDHEDIDKKTIEAKKEQEMIRQKLFALKSKESSPSMKQNQRKRKLSNCEIDNNGFRLFLQVKAATAFAKTSKSKLNQSLD